MQAPRYPFTIDRSDDIAIVDMHVDGLIRRRTMSLYVLDALVRVCEQIRCELLRRLLRDPAFREAIAAYPECSECLRFEGLAGICNVTVVASRDGTDIEFCTALYDLDDASAPALVLVADQLDDFIREAKRVLIAAAAERPPTA